ncbi:MAG: hypothetical protein ACKO2K_16455, partial [Alphaproteobacteria bacterium]
MRRLAIGLALATSLGGCAASRPVVYPNDFYLQSGQSDDQRKAALDQAIAECEALAKQTGVTANAGRAEQAAKTAGIGAVGGAAAGVVMLGSKCSLISSRRGRGAVERVTAATP